MSNLHKDLLNSELHDPKDFSTASNDTKLCKNSSGDLEWKADTGGGGLVTSLTTTGTSGASTLSGAGVLNIPNYATGGGLVTSLTTTGVDGAATLSGAGVLNIPDYQNQVTRNLEAYGEITVGTEYGLNNAQYNNEHKFVVDLGAPVITGISPKNMVSTSIWCNPQASNVKRWIGWIWGAGGTIALNLYRCAYQCPVPMETPATLDLCQIATKSIILAGNSNPQCWDIADFVSCEGEFPEQIQPGEMLILTAYIVEGEEVCTFNLNCNFLLGI